MLDIPISGFTFKCSIQKYSFRVGLFFYKKKFRKNEGGGGEWEGGVIVGGFQNFKFRYFETFSEFLSRALRLLNENSVSGGL